MRQYFALVIAVVVGIFYFLMRVSSILGPKQDVDAPLQVGDSALWAVAIALIVWLICLVLAQRIARMRDGATATSR